MFNSFSKEVALTAVSTAGVQITLSRIILSPGSLFKGKALIRITRQGQETSDASPARASQLHHPCRTSRRSLYNDGYIFYQLYTRYYPI
jgi:hypothetical protein